MITANHKVDKRATKPGDRRPTWPLNTLKLKGEKKTNNVTANYISDFQCGAIKEYKEMDEKIYGKKKNPGGRSPSLALTDTILLMHQNEK